MASSSAQSIYACLNQNGSLNAVDRRAKRARTRARMHVVSAEAPTTQFDRMTAIYAIIRGYREGNPVQALSFLELRIEEVTQEVEALEKWANHQPESDQTNGHTIRKALELLRMFGRMAALDFSQIPTEERPQLIRLLALEHRWCYAAAGTSRDQFKLATGRTGAR